MHPEVPHRNEREEFAKQKATEALEKLGNAVPGESQIRERPELDLLDESIFTDITDSKTSRDWEVKILKASRDAARADPSYSGPGAMENEEFRSMLLTEMPEAEWMEKSGDHGMNPLLGTVKKHEGEFRVVKQDIWVPFTEGLDEAPEDDDDWSEW